ncbi:MAG: hypothetical protein CM15mP93_17220 [Thiotrichaceae bacterium]|nr:MAG: hypothetical protein CM15mP93_17220 [Thiotrichaceae bacterium]
MEAIKYFTSKTSPSVKLISCVSDELRIITHSWDEKLLKFIRKIVIVS